ncbi:MAG: transketolase [Bacteroidetes bacterium GWF2_41_61]|jgi:transketolase|nr:MAG: transketolase [Bacteroidetes bacterium GWF2_41_61]OFY89046.1 MAG: transketolase [Bacteroidetes bacterium RIFOXYA12_FULL_40_10]PKP07370.1 MAG: transketolase [Bacteroidetes bacterium HGW-Bacteroidetes-5]HBG24236.1 transketolase [Rikenellaceae bacterium]
MKITEKFINTGNKDTRSGFGAGLLEVGRENADVIALCADLTGSLKMEAFAAEFPDRFIQCGIAEANMIGTSAGLALSGKIPYAGTFAGFATGRVYDQVRQSVAYSETNVKICASHAGITLGEDGATHQIMEDIGLMRMLPNLVVINPCDYNQTKAATIEIAKHHGPVYLRFGRPSVPNFTPADAKFEIGKAITLAQGRDVTIFATGHLVWEAIVAAGMLEDEGISVEVINIHTIKPLDKKAVLESAAKTGAVVTAEEHLIAGGMGELIAAFLAKELPTPTEFVAVDDLFGQSGEPAELLKEYKLSSINIADAVKRVIAKKLALSK